ncbi:response regulator [Spirosoma sp. SC4-14]|uniref:response regulator n=1 Tax=Spirosoma sp. SC4-14 TaxID=3128900 RepID=UPI0030CB5752
MTPTFSECIFTVDDDEDDRFLLQQVFLQQSPTCLLKPIPNGEKLVEILAQTDNLPTLILLDLNMPFMSGFEVLKIIRENRTYDSVQVVIFTTSDNIQDQQQALKLGANGFLTKPATLEELNQIVLHIKHKWLLGKCISPKSCC